MQNLEGLFVTTEQLELADGEKTYQEWQKWALKEKRKLATLPDLYKAGEKESEYVLKKMQEDFRKYTIITGTTVNAIKGKFSYLGGEIMHSDGAYGGGNYVHIPTLKAIPIKEFLRAPTEEYVSMTFHAALCGKRYSNKKDTEGVIVEFIYNLFHHEQWASPEKIIPPLERLTGLPAEKILIQSNTKQSSGVVLRTLPAGEILIDTTYPLDKAGRTYIFTQEFHPYSND